MEMNPAHVVAVIGGAVAGSEAAANLAKRGIKIIVFEQNIRPYGKIEDGLPKWHFKLQAKEENKIDEKLSDPNIIFVPNTSLTRDLDFQNLVTNWGFSAILLANGAWRDRPLAIEGIDEFVGKGLIYQNDLVKWFNHYHEEDYSGEHYKIEDDAIIIGGGLASLDVVKIVMLETVLDALKKRNIKSDILELEHDSISKILAKHNLKLNELGLKGCTLFYRRRINDMPLAQMPLNAAPEAAEKIYAAREKILKNFQDKYLFNIKPCSVPTGMIVEDNKLGGLKFKETEIIDGKVIIKEDTEYDIRSSQIISSIGSIPEKIEGVDMKDELYDFQDSETGQLKQYENVFALGNVVTGKGNIKASFQHGKQVAFHLMDNFLAWKEEDYEKIFEISSQRAEERVSKIAEILKEKKLLRTEQIQTILDKVITFQKRAGYNGSYSDWIAEHKLKSFNEYVEADR
jgi:NADPH-dependent glutamate synthase beta subunit-like oxidoreductase